MKLRLSVLILFSVLGSAAVGQQSEFAIGRAYYTEGQFKKAAVHFQLALETNPDDAESCYWLGMSYRVLADIAAPFDHKYISKAHIYLTMAMDLAPGRPEYRRELFSFLLDSAASSPATLRQAAGILQTFSESDPEYPSMRRQFEPERRVNSSVDTRLRRLFIAAPRTAYRIAELPASQMSRRSGPGAVIGGLKSAR